MDYAIAVFTVRTHTMMFYQLLRSYGIKCVVIETPKQAHLSCGISVKFLEKDFPVVKKLLTKQYASFLGFYKIQSGYQKLVILPLK